LRQVSAAERATLLAVKKVGLSAVAMGLWAGLAPHSNIQAKQRIGM